ncbi:uncharacterized protein LOC134220022 isoform X1 [Armigeres subalbatus]|uniref:uncharacterized protein LOC134220022 isoform X1 n=2 Tax=Armigeres subalbatus TaxID=124917 RepID=UPI002ED3DC92
MKIRLTKIPTRPIMMNSMVDQSVHPVVTVPQIVSVVSEVDHQPCDVQIMSSDSRLSSAPPEELASIFDDGEKGLTEEIIEYVAGSMPSPSEGCEEAEQSKVNIESQSNTASMEMLYPSEQNQDESNQPNGTTSTSNVENESPNISPKRNSSEGALLTKCTSTSNAENESPNISHKRNSSEGALLTKCTKKQASTEMKFRCFDINWSKISDHLLDRLRALQEFKKSNPGVFIPAAIRITKTELTTLINTVVEQLRIIDTRIRADTMETVARQILEKFPALDYTDDDGFGGGQGYIELKYKMINRNNYLNRFRNSQPHQTLINSMSLKKKRNERAGTLSEYWAKYIYICARLAVSGSINL